MYTQLLGGAYESRSLISAAQRCVNLYIEAAPQTTGEPSPYVHLPTPGLTLLSTYPLAATAANATVRGAYTASNGIPFVVCNNDFYFINVDWSWFHLGTLSPSTPSDATPRTTPVSMVDNGKILLIVDGSSDGWTLDLTTLAFARIRATFSLATSVDTAAGSAILTFTDTTGVIVGQPVNATSVTIGATVDSFTTTTVTLSNVAEDLIPAGTPIEFVNGFLGSPRVDFSDTFFILAQPGTPNFYISGSEAITFDPSDFAAKAAKPDRLFSLIVEHRVLWLLGAQTTEVWYDNGGGDLPGSTFSYEPLPGTFFDRGLAAPWSVARADNQIFFLAADPTGAIIVMRGRGYTLDRISTFAIEAEFSKYTVIGDAIGFCYTQQGHTFFQLTFPTADKTWCFDATMNLWHEKVWLDDNGHEHRHRANCGTAAYGKVIVGDFENGNLYELDLDNYTDNGRPILRLRSFPHMIDPDGNRRVFYNSFIANMQVGSGDQPLEQTVIDCNFTAPDGTLLQDYAGGLLGSVWTQFDTATSGQVFDNEFTGTVAGSTSYIASGIPFSPDYGVQYQAIPSDYGAVPLNDVYIYAIGRADPTDSYNGYKVQIFSNGSQYSVVFDVMTFTSTTIALGTLSSGYYAVEMDMDGDLISIAVQRSQDGKWVDATGTWQGSKINCISIVDTHYTEPGRVLIGGNF